MVVVAVVAVVAGLLREDPKCSKVELAAVVTVFAEQKEPLRYFVGVTGSEGTVVKVETEEEVDLNEREEDRERVLRLRTGRSNEL